jgi:hypothetical protein
MLPIDPVDLILPFEASTATVHSLRNVTLAIGDPQSNNRKQKMHGNPQLSRNRHMGSYTVLLPSTSSIPMTLPRQAPVGSSEVE